MAASNGNRPELWSDFDGTAVGLASKFDPRNWAKYPLPLMAGYPDFLRGVMEEGVTIGGTVSRRPNIAPRRYVTRRSIVELGLAEFFTTAEHVILAGSELAKAIVVARQSKGERVVGLLDDKPHRVGTELVRLARKEIVPAKKYVRSFDVVVGAVSCAKRAEYNERLFDYALATEACNVSNPNGDDLQIEANGSRLRVVCLEPYSYEAGQSFARQLLNTAAQ
jgi:hypothetical protein